MQQEIQKILELCQELSIRISNLKQTIEQKNILLISDVAHMTGLSNRTIYKLTCRKKIPHYKPNGKRLYFVKAEIEEWMKQGRVNVTNEAK